MADNMYLPQVDYTSRDYTAIRDDLKALIPNFAPNWKSTDSSDFGIVLLELFSYMGDLLNFQIDRAANEAFLSTATQRETVLNLAKLLGYFPNDITPATGAVTFTNANVSSQAIPAGTRVYSSGTTPVLFTVDSAFTIGASTSTTATVTQGLLVANESVGTSNGSVNQEFALANTGVMPGSLTSNLIQVYVNGYAYNRVASIIDAASTDQSFYSYTDGNGVTHVGFGDGVSGIVPPNGASITVSYRYSDTTGSLGNVPAASIVSVDVSALTGAAVSVTNANAFSGGTDIETTDSIRVNAPLAARTITRAVSLADYQTLALTYASVAKAAAVASSYGSVSLYIALANAGVPSSTLLSSIKSWFADKIPPGTTVTPVAYTRSYPYLNVTVAVLPQYNAANIQAQVKAALASLFAFDNVTFADLISEGDVFATCKAVNGVNYITINDFEKLPASTSTTGIYSQTAVTNGSTASAATSVTVLSTAGLYTGALITAPSSMVGQTVNSINSTTVFTLSSGATATTATGTTISIQGNNGLTAGNRDLTFNANEVPVYEPSYITVTTTGGSS